LKNDEFTLEELYQMCSFLMLGRYICAPACSTISHARALYLRSSMFHNSSLCVANHHATRAKLVEWIISIAVVPKVVDSTLSLVGSGQRVIVAATPTSDSTQILKEK